MATSETDKRWKGRKIDWLEIADMDASTEEMKHLTQQQVAILLMLLDYQKWETRWHNLALTKNELESFIGDIENRLMTNEECPILPLDCEEVEACLATSDIISDINSDIDNVEGDVGSNGSNGYKPSSPTKVMQDTTGYGTFGADMVVPTGGCNDDDKDRLWSVITKVVFYTHIKNSGFLASIAANASLDAAYAQFASFLPLGAVMGAIDAINFMDDILSNARAAYDTTTTNDFLYDICEDLFCAATSCTFSLEDFEAYCATNAGGSYSAAVTTFLDIEGNLIGQVTGAGLFYALSWLQIHVLGLGEKFSDAMSIQNLATYAKTAPPDRGWQTWATDCYSHSGIWTLVLDYANDYTPSGSEIVFRNMFGIWTQVSGVATTLTNVYKKGIVFTNTGSQNVVKQVNFTNAPLCTDIQANVRKVSGTASSVGILFTSNTYSGQPRRNFSSSSFAWTTAVPLANVGGTAGALNYFRFDLNTTLASQTCVAEIRYLRLTGTGALPRIA